MGKCWLCGVSNASAEDPCPECGLHEEGPEMTIEVVLLLCLNIDGDGDVAWSDMFCPRRGQAKFYINRDSLEESYSVAAKILESCKIISSKRDHTGFAAALKAAHRSALINHEFFSDCGNQTVTLEAQAVELIT